MSVGRGIPHIGGGEEPHGGGRERPQEALLSRTL